MKTAIERVVIFALALRAHREFFHRRVHAIIWQCFDDRKARAAIRAVGEWITEPAIGWIDNLAKAIGAGRDVGKNQSRFLAAIFRFMNLKCAIPNWVEKRRFEAVDHGARRFFFSQPKQKLSQRVARALDFDENSLG